MILWRLTTWCVEVLEMECSANHVCILPHVTWMGQVCRCLRTAWYRPRTLILRESEWFSGEIRLSLLRGSLLWPQPKGRQRWERRQSCVFVVKSDWPPLWPFVAYHRLMWPPNKLFSCYNAFLVHYRGVCFLNWSINNTSASKTRSNLPLEASPGHKLFMTQNIVWMENHGHCCDSIVYFLFYS